MFLKNTDRFTLLRLPAVQGFVMKRFQAKRHLRWIWRYETVALAATLVVGGLMGKPVTETIAQVPKVAASPKQSKATATARIEHREEQVRQIRPENYDVGRYPVSQVNEGHWRNILWTTAVVQPQEPFVLETLDQILAMMVQPGLSDSQMRTIDTAAKVGNQLYVSNPTFYARLGNRLMQAISQSPDPEWVAISLSGLAKAGLSPTQLQPLAESVKKRFPRWSKNAYLQTTIREIAELISPRPTPPLSDLLNWTIAPRQLHLYVFCQPDRYVLCQSVLKDAKGEFVREPGGKLWSVPLLLRSIHNLNWNFVRGQTPQGIYRIEGEVPQPDDEYFRAYGQFSLVNLFIPFESGVKQFLPGQPGTFNGSIDAYQKLLPPSWRNAWSLQQSYWAGKIGRSEFRIHGTGDAPNFFSGKEKNPDSYNWNPSIGCLSALELYNEQGQLIEADMPKLLNALETVGGKNFTGYMVVTEVPNGLNKPIALEQIEAALSKGQPKAQSLPRKLEKPPASVSQVAQPRAVAQQAPTAPAQVEVSFHENSDERVQADPIVPKFPIAY